MSYCDTAKNLLAAILLVWSGSSASADGIQNFTTGYSSGATSFTDDGLNFSLTGYLSVFNSDDCGSGGDDYYVDSGYGSSSAGFIGAIICTTPGSGFYFTGVDLWTSASQGAINASGIVTIIGTNALTGATITDLITVQPTGSTGADWDTTNDLSSFSGIALSSVEFHLNDASIDYVAIDNFAVTAVSVPEPSQFAAFGALCVFGFAAFKRIRRVK